MIRLFSNTHQMPRELWVQARRMGIGGSDAGTLLGMNPYASRQDLALDKRGEVEPPDLSDNEAVRWGNLLEDVVANEVAQRLGLTIRRVNAILADEVCPWMLANLDREIINHPMGTGVLEIKTTADGRDWGPSGSDQVPDRHYIQVQQYLGVTGRDHAVIGVLIGGRDLRTYPVKRDDAVIDHLRREITRFWLDHIRDGLPVPPETEADLRRTYPRDNGQAIEADHAIGAKWTRLVQVKREIKALESEKTALENAIKQTMGDAANLTMGAHTLATWRARSGFDAQAFEAAHPALAEQYRKGLDVAAIRKAHPALAEQYTTTAGRTLLIKEL